MKTTTYTLTEVTPNLNRVEYNCLNDVDFDNLESQAREWLSNNPSMIYDYCSPMSAMPLARKLLHTDDHCNAAIIDLSSRIAATAKYMSRN